MADKPESKVSTTSRLIYIRREPVKYLYIYIKDPDSRGRRFILFLNISHFQAIFFSFHFLRIKVLQNLKQSSYKYILVRFFQLLLTCLHGFPSLDKQSIVHKSQCLSQRRCTRYPKFSSRLKKEFVVDLL